VANRITLVTGGAGFVGNALVKMLLKRGEKVRVLDLDASSLTGLDVEILTGSILDKKDTQRACMGVTSVIHLAGNAQLWARQSGVFENTNIAGTKMMLEAASQANVSRFVHCSSLTTLVGNKTPIGKSEADENTILTADEMLGDYPRSKRLAEVAVLDFVKNQAEKSDTNSDLKSMDVVIAIPTEPLGAGDDNLTPPTQMILDFVNRRTPAYINCILNFVPVSFLAKGLIAVRDYGENGERYILGGQNIPLGDLLKRLGDITNVKMPNLCLPYQVALMAGFFDTTILARITGKAPKAPLTGVRLAGRQVHFSSEKVKAQLGWQSPPIDDALREMLNWAVENNHIHDGVVIKNDKFTDSFAKT